MKKRITTILRSVIAAAGIAYVVWMVDLADRVEIPADTVLPNARHIDKPTNFKVVEGHYTPLDPTGELVIQIDDDSGQYTTMPIPQGALGTGPGDLRFVPGLTTMLRQADKKMLLLGLLVVAVIYPILMVRWWLLMRSRDMTVSLWKAFRLTMVGNFFNFCMPGTTGGDLVKAYYAAKGSGRRADAVMSVIVDRICGLLGLLILAGVAGLFMLNDESARQITLYIWLICSGAVVGSVVYFSKTLRGMFGVDWLLSKLPAGQVFASIDAAAFAYRHHKMIVLYVIAMSIVLHIALVSATATAGYALGMQTPFSLLLIVIPVSFLVGAIPISPQGIGVMEFFAVAMLRSSLAFPNQIVGMLIMIRLYQIFYSLLGSVFLLKGDIHLHPQGEMVSESIDATSDQPSATV